MDNKFYIILNILLTFYVLINDDIRILSQKSVNINL